MGFLLGVLVAGPLCDSKGRRSLLVWGAIAYCLSALACALSNNFFSLMAARFIQGFAMTGPVIAGCVIMLERTSGAGQVFWMSLTNSVVTFAMALSPIVGNWINDRFGFKGSLWSIFALGAVCALPALFIAPETLKNKQKFRTQEVLSKYIRLCTDFRFIMLAIPICALAAAYWIYVGVSALYMVDYLGVRQSAFSWYQAPIVGSFAVFSLCSSALLKRFGFVRCMQIGFACVLTGSFGLLIVSAFGNPSALVTTLLMILLVGGEAPACNMIYPCALKHLPQELSGSAQALIHALRLAFASVGTFLLGFLYTGPFLPVAAIMAFLTCVSALSLWCARKHLSRS